MNLNNFLVKVNNNLSSGSFIIGALNLHKNFVLNPDFIINNHIDTSNDLFKTNIYNKKNPIQKSWYPVIK